MAVSRKFPSAFRMAAGLLLILGANPAFAEGICEPSEGLDQAAAGERVDPSSKLMSRVAPASELVLQTYRDSGATGIASHHVTDTESASIETAFAALPELHRQVLLKHLRHLSFVDTQPGAGNALTSKVATCDGTEMFDLTLRAGIFHETLTEFLNVKERGLFKEDKSGYSVHLEAGSLPALTYILLHEATHGVDQALHISDGDDTGFRDGIWADQGDALAKPYADGPIAGTIWHGGRKIPGKDIPALYRSLSASPFPTLYAASSVPQDLAEIVAWEQLATRFGTNLRVDVKDGRGRVVYSYDALDAPLVRARFRLVEELLRRRED